MNDVTTTAASRESMIPVAPEERERMIRDAAYYHAERHGFNGGGPIGDWLAAESEIDALLASMARAPRMPGKKRSR